jgi:hypothetical protein
VAASSPAGAGGRGVVDVEVVLAGVEVVVEVVVGVDVVVVVLAVVVVVVVGEEVVVVVGGTAAVLAGVVVAVDGTEAAFGVEELPHPAAARAARAARAASGLRRSSAKAAPRGGR